MAKAVDIDLGTVMGELRRHFRSEFLNRVDDVLLFKPVRVGVEGGELVVLYDNPRDTWEAG